MSSRYDQVRAKVEAKDDDVVPDDTSLASAAKSELSSAGISVTKSGKKRGTIFKCESCSKVSMPRFDSDICSEVLRGPITIHMTMRMYSI